MRRKDFSFCFIVIASVFLFRKIPFQLFLERMGLGTSSEKIKAVVFNILIIVACVLIAKWKNVLKEGGFVKPVIRNSWMVCIPLIYPGITFVNELNLGCLNAFLPALLSVLLIFTAGLMEEVLFRGVIQGYIASRYSGKSPGNICLISALLFAIVHLTNLQYSDLDGVLQQVVYAFIMGLLFGILLIRTKSIWLLGFVHGAVNFLSYRCSDDVVVGQNNGPVSYQITLSDLGNIAGEIFVLSPIILIYWLLLRTMKPNTAPVKS